MVQSSKHFFAGRQHIRRQFRAERSSPGSGWLKKKSLSLSEFRSMYFTVQNFTVHPALDIPSSLTSAGSPAQAPTDLAGLSCRQIRTKKKRGRAPLRYPP
jgi:hypothetical protein